jgi:hypothetical protein
MMKKVTKVGYLNKMMKKAKQQRKRQSHNEEGRATKEGKARKKGRGEKKRKKRVVFVMQKPKTHYKI